MAWSISQPLSKTLLSSNPDSLLPSSSTPRQQLASVATITRNSSLLNHQLKYNKKISYRTKTSLLLYNSSFTRHICRAAEYKFPDPIPEFADAETEKFKTHLLKKLSKKDVCGDSIEEVVGLCTERLILVLLYGRGLYVKSAWNGYAIAPFFFVAFEVKIFSTFLHSEYGGPGTLLVIPFIDMADTINERGLPGGPQAARAAVKWAQAHVDKHWNEWNGDSSS